MDPPLTLYDIDPQYPKRTPEQWLNETFFISTVASFNLSTHHSFRFSLQHFLYNQLNIILIIASVLIIVILIVTCLFCQYYETSWKNRRRSQTISIGGECSSLSQWLTRERFKDDHDTHRLLRKSSEDSDQSADDYITFTKDISFHHRQ